MAEYIEREALKKRIATEYGSRYYTEYHTGFHHGLSVAYASVCEAPAADVAPVVHGRWINEGVYVTTAYGSLDVYSCSVCGSEITIDGFDSYCPNCGAKMEGDC